jgi:hypothetical protein
MRKSPFEPCIPTRGTKVPAGPDWLHEVKHDGYRLIVQREWKLRGFGPLLLVPGERGAKVPAALSLVPGIRAE